MLKKDKMVRAWMYRLSKKELFSYNSNIIKPKLQHIQNAHRFMLEAYSKPCHISKMIRHIERPCLATTVYLGIFEGYTQGHSAKSSHVLVYWGRLRHIEANSGIIEAHWALFTHIQNYVTIACKILPYLKHWHQACSQGYSS